MLIKFRLEIVLSSISTIQQNAERIYIVNHTEIFNIKGSCTLRAVEN